MVLTMEVRTYEGYDFLLIEKGGFNTAPTTEEESEVAKDWHCGYHVYIRLK